MWLIVGFPIFLFLLFLYLLYHFILTAPPASEPYPLRGTPVLLEDPEKPATPSEDWKALKGLPQKSLDQAQESYKGKEASSK